MTDSLALTPLRTDAPLRPLRVWGLDLARFLAVVGMMLVHLWGMTPDGTETAVAGFVSGKAAALFALLAGVGIALSTGSDIAAGQVWAARAAVFGRGVALILIGLTLSLIPGSVVVILVYYGVLFWVLIPLLRLPSAVLLTAAGVLAVVWPWLSQILRDGLPISELGSPSWLQLADVGGILRGLLLTGVYPVPTWIVYALVGLVVGRAIIAATAKSTLRALSVRLAIGGVVLAAAAQGIAAILAPLALQALTQQRSDMEAVIETVYTSSGFGTAPTGSPWWLASSAAHTGTTLDLAITTGSALAVLGACIALGTALPVAVQRALEPVRRAGAAPLTVYSVHVVAVGAAVIVALGGEDFTLAPWYVNSPQLWVLHVLGAVLIGVVLTVLRRRGPLETLVTATARLVSQPWRRSSRRAETAGAANPVDR